MLCLQHGSASGFCFPSFYLDFHSPHQAALLVCSFCFPGLCLFPLAHFEITSSSCHAVPPAFGSSCSELAASFRPGSPVPRGTEPSLPFGLPSTCLYWLVWYQSMPRDFSFMTLKSLETVKRAAASASQFLGS